MNTLNEKIIDIKNLTRKFEKQTALDNITMKVSKGQVFGIIGENGAGKTTLIKHILGLYKAQQGSVSVFDLDPVENPIDVLGHIGYLSENPELPSWMTVLQYLNYMSAFYKSWDKDYAIKLSKVLDLNLSKKISELSKGQVTRVGLCAVQAHRPKLLLLDEPSSGLDPLIRADVLTAVCRTAADEGRTVIFSSHLLEEVETVCDNLLMIKKGNIVFSDSSKNISSNHHRITLLDDTSDNWRNLPNLLHFSKKTNCCELDFSGQIDEVIGELKKQSFEIVNHRPMTLNEIFVAHSSDMNVQKELL